MTIDNKVIVELIIKTVSGYRRHDYMYLKYAYVDEDDKKADIEYNYAKMYKSKIHLLRHLCNIKMDDMMDFVDNFDDIEYKCTAVCNMLHIKLADML